MSELGHRPEPMKPSRAYKAAAMAVKACAKVPGLNVTATGLENLPEEGGFVLAFTHHNSWDVPAVGYSVYEHTGRPVHFLGKQELYSLPAVGKALRALHGLPISRETPAPSQMRAALDVLNQGEILGLAPEGGRVHYEDRIGTLQRGAGWLAAKTSSVIVPVGIEGKPRRVGDRSLWYLPRTLHAYFGEPIEPDVSADTRAASEQMEQLLPGRLQAVRNKAFHDYADRYGNPYSVWRTGDTI